MKRFFIFSTLLLLILILTACAPAVGNNDLRLELLQREEADQAALKAFMEAPNFAETLMQQQQQVNRDNTARLKEIVEKYGWPGFSLVGQDGARAAWLLAQHADHDVAFQKQCLELLHAAVEKGEALPRHAAYLYDRVAVNGKRPQRYGTQGHCTGPGRWGPFTLEDAQRVDEYRTAAGLSTLAEYTQNIAPSCPPNITYVPTP
ncbi:hypothetical protein TFLX_02311 [Thermoflexales bacterium]|nr:hypothetical protein TFLX_02311 [Thermoflexales bacterium]